MQPCDKFDYGIMTVKKKLLADGLINFRNNNFPGNIETARVSYVMVKLTGRKSFF